MNYLEPNILLALSILLTFPMLISLVNSILYLVATDLHFDHGFLVQWNWYISAIVEVGFGWISVFGDREVLLFERGSWSCMDQYVD